MHRTAPHTKELSYAKCQRHSLIGTRHGGASVGVLPPCPCLGPHGSHQYCLSWTAGTPLAEWKPCTPSQQALSLFILLWAAVTMSLLPLLLDPGGREQVENSLESFPAHNRISRMNRLATTGTIFRQVEIWFGPLYSEWFINAIIGFNYFNYL